MWLNTTKLLTHTLTCPGSACTSNVHQHERFSFSSFQDVHLRLVLFPVQWCQVGLGLRKGRDETRWQSPAKAHHLMGPQAAALPLHLHTVTNLTCTHHKVTGKPAMPLGCKVRAEVRHYMSWILKGWREVTFAVSWKSLSFFILFCTSRIRTRYSD